MKGFMARSWTVKRATPSPPEREVPNSCVKRGVSVGERMEKVYDIVAVGDDLNVVEVCYLPCSRDYGPRPDCLATEVWFARESSS